MVFITDYKVEEYVLNTGWDDFPESVKNQAIMCAIDLFGALIIGSQGRQYRVGKRISKLLGLQGEIPVFSDGKFNVLGASIVYSHAANSFDIDDGYNMVKGHPGASFIGGVLSAALEKGVSCKDFLSTLIVCYEIAIRWGLVEQHHYKYLHSTGTYGAFATAAGIGRLYRLDKELLNQALSIADYHAPLTPVMRAVEYPSMNKDGVPFGSLIGTMAVIEATSGETGKTHLLEMPEYNDYVSSLGSRYYIKELYFKRYTCCRWAHQPIKACIDLMNLYEIAPRQIKKVIVHTFIAATKLSKEKPNDTDEAQYNIAFPVAAAIIHGDVGFEQINDKGIHDQDVLNMMNRLSFVVDPDLEKQFPEKRLASVEMVLFDGSILKSGVYEAPGEASDPELSLDWIIDKFIQRTQSIINKECQKNVISILTKHSSDKVSKIIELINSGFIE